MSDDQLRQYREDIKKVVPQEHHAAIDRVPCYDSFPKGLAGKIVKLLPQKIRGYAVALFYVAGVLVGIMVMDDKAEQWYRHHEVMIDDCAVATADAEATLQMKLGSPAFMHHLAEPHNPAPIPYQPIAEIGGAYTSNTSVTVHGLKLTVPMGTSFVSITGPRSLDGVEFISLKKKPLV